MDSLIFEVQQEDDGGYVAEALTEDIVTQGDTWPELCANVLEAVNVFYLEDPSHKPKSVRLRHVRTEVIDLSKEELTAA
ncbi:Uncharacterized protein family (UPF0150) [Terriglobus roseus DSM 18391]|uniref:Uncharacterized protein family (UPF0150) n=1 Tax=Terriglobus roseus (strain DSM 18391 / NRRL B-41598 / KBS 63) TaxID=926566 RepID=I3ZAU6_TERRK|nr:2-oxoisovalerate dehydrogenase E1 [Terriglobus roseus]AFL86364.1 Uncharacterized protein family (UPF0150) [Terriglobus roseus DSM 18391]